MTNVVLQRRTLGGLLTGGLGAAVFGTLATKAVRAAPTSDQIELVRRSNVGTR
jgi:hypothetical protein